MRSVRCTYCDTIFGAGDERALAATIRRHFEKVCHRPMAIGAAPGPE